MDFNEDCYPNNINTIYRCNHFCTVLFNSYHDPISDFSDIQIFEYDPGIKNIIIINTDGLTRSVFFDCEYSDTFTDFLDKCSVICFVDTFDEYDIQRIENIKRKTEKCRIFSFNYKDNEGYKEYIKLIRLPDSDLKNAEVKPYSDK